MNQTLQRLLNGQEDNCVLPFFWQHGEDAATLRHYMRAIHDANCGAVCVESRPHPDFCGPKWWADLDVILDEAKKLGMRVWILDDAHFPTGFSNGALKTAPAALCRQNVYCNFRDLPEQAGVCRIDLKKAGLLKPPEGKQSLLEKALTARPAKRRFSDDRIFCATAVQDGRRIDLSDHLQDGVLIWDKPTGKSRLSVCTLSRNTGAHRDYINMLERDSCRLLLDAVYEPHFARYAADFGGVIAGFFSDEPELGNGFLYAQGNLLGTEQDLPWSASLEAALPGALGPDWKTLLPLLWETGDAAETARVRSAYMDLVTRLVRDSFSYQIGDWCRAHGVAYIGHVIEDNGQHCRTGSSLGHYFRALEGQDMAGVDDIGGQVLPQGEDGPDQNQYRRLRCGEFYHYGLGKLAASAAAIEPNKRGNAMCEIFGNYGWAEGVRLEKYLADHFLVRGVNRFVPHAFSPKAFPDPDCPPHFYAHGHNPQYRHFGALMRYVNRVATLTSAGPHEIPAAILYHGESEWADRDAMPFEKPLRALYDAQIDCHVLPADVFAKPDFYRAQIGNPFCVNRQAYRVFIVPATAYLPRAAAQGLAALHAAGLPVLFAERRPEAIAESGAPLPEALLACPAVPLAALADAVRACGVLAPTLSPASDRVRILHVRAGTDAYLLINEAEAPYTGCVTLPSPGDCFLYDAWDNRCIAAQSTPRGDRTELYLTIAPLKSCIVLFGGRPESLPAPLDARGEDVPLSDWTRCVCEGATYPRFSEKKPVALPDQLAAELPKFSGYARYETRFMLSAPSRLTLVIEDAHEGVEVFVGGKSAGLQIAPPFVYDLSELAAAGENTLAIEVATTLERECYPLLSPIRKILSGKPRAQSGLTGSVRLYRQ